MFIVKLEAEVYARSGLIVELKAKEAVGFVIIEAAEEAGSTIMAEEEAEEEAESVLDPDTALHAAETGPGGSTWREEASEVATMTGQARWGVGYPQIGCQGQNVDHPPPVRTHTRLAPSSVSSPDEESYRLLSQYRLAARDQSSRAGGLSLENTAGAERGDLRGVEDGREVGIVDAGE